MRNMANGITFFFYGVGGVVFFLLNIQITHYKTIYVILVFLAMICLTLTFWLIETPYIFHKQENLKSFYEGLCYINQVNNERQPEVQAKNKIEIRNSIFQNKLSETIIQNSHSIKLLKKEKGVRENWFTDYKNIKGKIILQIIPKIGIKINFMENNHDTIGRDAIHCVCMNLIQNPILNFDIVFQY